jgi:alpha-tubulin suppressor-like RCC1 family protein
MGTGKLDTYTTPQNASQISVLLNPKNEIATSLYAGLSTTFIWTKSGTIYAFGLNANGQLGESSTTTQLLGNFVDSSNFNGSVVSFCATYQHSVFITNSGSSLMLSYILSIFLLFLF